MRVEAACQRLRAMGMEVHLLNEGNYHYRVTDPFNQMRVDFWAGTSRWRDLQKTGSDGQGTGLESLINYLMLSRTTGASPAAEELPETVEVWKCSCGIEHDPAEQCPLCGQILLESSPKVQGDLTVYPTMADVWEATRVLERDLNRTYAALKHLQSLVGHLTSREQNSL